MRTGLLMGAGLATSGWTGITGSKKGSRENEQAFRMKFSGEFDMFSSAGKDLEDQLQWGYDHGFRAWESTWLTRRSVEEQERIARKMGRSGCRICGSGRRIAKQNPGGSEGFGGDRQTHEYQVYPQCIGEGGSEFTLGFSDGECD